MQDRSDTPGGCSTGSYENYLHLKGPG